MALRERLGVTGPVVRVHIPSILIPTPFPFSATGPLGLVFLDRKDVGDMSPIEIVPLRSIRARAGGSVRR
ncbi:MAG: hypothetical protein QXE50_05835 [Nitrososphaerota archaeon]